jgi:hypothetical protein
MGYLAPSQKTCFVIAPNDVGSEARKRSDQILRHIIQPAITETGYTPLRADKVSKHGRITPQVIEHVLNDPLVIADLTEQTPAVFYELAIRHAIQKPFVQLIEKDEPIPFDLESDTTVQLNHKDHEDNSQAVKKLIEQIRSAEERPMHVHTPVSIALQILHSRLNQSRSRTTLPRFTGKLGECKVLAKMIMCLDPYTGADRPDFPLRDSIGYFPSTEVTGLASGIYDLYTISPGFPRALAASGVTILRQPVPHPVKPHTDLCEKLHLDSLYLIRTGSIPHLTIHHFKRLDTECDCYCHKE